MQTTSLNFCWWCGTKADTREHIFKKSDHLRIFGKPPYTINSQPMIEFAKDKRCRVQGPSSDLLKFKTNLCKNCNNNRSSEFDKSYALFITGIKCMFQDIIKERVIDFQNIYGPDWSIGIDNLVKYYSKHIGCRLSHDGIEVPRNLVDHLDGKDGIKDFVLRFEIRPLNFVIEHASNENNSEIRSFEILKAGKMTLIENKAISPKFRAYMSWLTTSWISINYIVEEGINQISGLNYGSKSCLPVHISSHITPPGFMELTIAKKIDLVEEYDRILSPATNLEFYNRTKYGL